MVLLIIKMLHLISYVILYYCKNKSVGDIYLIIIIIIIKE